MKPLPCPPDRLPREGETIFGYRITTRSKADYKIDTETGCWVWQKFLLRGYAHSGTRRMHRLYYERAYGPIPEGFDLHHRCENTACVNPEHMEPIELHEHRMHHHLNLKAGITLEDVREIRRLGRLPGASAREIAARFGIHHVSVYNYWLGRRWSFLLDESGPVDLAPWTCTAPDCSNPVTGNRQKRYCSPTCRSRTNQRRARESAASNRKEA